MFEARSSDPWTRGAGHLNKGLQSGSRIRIVHTHKPEIDCATIQLTSSRTPTGRWKPIRSAMTVQWYQGWDDENTKVWLTDIGGSLMTNNWTLEIPVDSDGTPMDSSVDSRTPDIEIIRASTFDDLSGSEVSIETFTQEIRERSGLVGATVVVTTVEYPGEIVTINPCGGWASTELWR